MDSAKLADLLGIPEETVQEQLGRLQAIILEEISLWNFGSSLDDLDRCFWALKAPPPAHEPPPAGQIPRVDT